MARENRSDRGAMLALASLLVVFSLTVAVATPAGAYFYDSDGDGLPDFYEAKHGIHGDVTDEGSDWDGDGLLDTEEDVNLNGIVDVGETDPANSDTDGDGISDGIEGLVDSAEDEDLLINALDLDSDGDFIPDGIEDANHNGVWDEHLSETNWLVADTDGDGLIDGWEAMWGTDPLDPNSDDDAWNDYEEVIVYGTNPNDPDTDGDGRVDGIGNEDGTDADGDGAINAADFDSDNDGLTDGQEDINENGVWDWTDTGRPIEGETDPTLYDTDGDGFSDGYEAYEAGSDPLNGTDTDGDGWYDGEEIAVYKTDPYNVDTDGDGRWDSHGNEGAQDSDGDGLINALDLDSDNDGIDDEDEDVNGDAVVDVDETDPTDVDTDGDGLEDNAEYNIYGTSPIDADDPMDSDGLDPGDEIYTYKTNFDMDDTDGDGVVEGLTGSGVDLVGNNFDGGRAKPFGDSSTNALDVDTDGDGIWDGDEASHGTDMMDWDSDDDGLLDGEEVYIWLTDPANDDTDDDGLEDGAEVNTHWTNPLDPNTDGDYVNDGVEVNVWGSNPLDPDTDGDSIMDGETIIGHYIDTSGVEQEWTFTEDESDVELGGDGLPNWEDVDADWRESEDPPAYTYLDFNDRTEMVYESYVGSLVRGGARFEIGPLNPGDPDTDGDGYPDAQEVACGFDPLDGTDYGDCGYVPFDEDVDGLYDIEEHVLGTDHEVMDTDGDGLDDGDEMHPTWWNTDGIAQVWATDPLDADMDNDGLDDDVEIGLGTNPHYNDTDGDGIADGNDNNWYDALNPDVDGDGLYDGYEDANPPGGNGVWDWASPDFETDADDGDTDDDGIYDGDELIFGTLPLVVDTDEDGLGDGLEVGYSFATIGSYTAGWIAGDGDDDASTMTDPRLVDSDFDGIDDNDEDVNLNGLADAGETDAADRDTDDDGLPDYYEALGNIASSPYCVGWVDNSADTTTPDDLDTDGDGLRDDIEFAQECDPNDGDTDGDTLSDGDEYVSYFTDPTNTDTDSDGCVEDDAGYESVLVDTDNDGAHNAMDVDSDNDWVWDGDGSEDCAGVNDGDGDGVPDIWDNDTDNDNLSDVQEMGLDTWHEFADNDRDFDEDGILDGDEYYQVIHQPHTGELGFEASDPKLFDTDQDGLHDGFERGKIAAIPVDPVYGGTNPDPGFWDADSIANSHPSLYDTDMDGFSDYVEDDDLDGDNGDIGSDEPDPRDDDTDDDGLIDGYELIYGLPERDPGTNCLWFDTDDDGLMDGLEWGLLRAMGGDTAPVNPFFGHARYDIMEDGAYTTNPLDDDTDGDGLLDGVEDDDFDGFRDGNDPHDTTSDWGGAGETDPNVCDTDRGGVDDGTEVLVNGTDPLLYTVGDWDIDFSLVSPPVRAAGDTLDVGTAGVGILPGSDDVSTVWVIHTDVGLNPDATDGPSEAAWGIDDVYLVATSLHWAGPLWGYPPADYSAAADTLDWIHYSAVSFSPSSISDFAAGTAVDVAVTVDVPEGAMPGWYVGYVQVETERPNASWGEGDDCITEQELPDDYIVIRVYVAPQKDIDICDDDGDPLGVGLASDPYDFWESGAIGEMHLMGAPMHPNGIEGMFRVANPNTYPDGDWPYKDPPEPPDGINDLNGLPAMPWIGRDWDLNTLDPQGNVDLTYDIEAQFEWEFERGIGPIDPTSAISFDSPLTAGMALATIDSFFVYIDTSTLPMGSYEGIVRVFEDIPHGIVAPNGTWDGDEVFDTFVLKFMLVLPDLDIDDDYAGLAGNELYIEVEPGEVDVAIGEFRVYAAGEDTNVDDWDGPGSESILDLAYYDPETDTLEKIPADGSDPISFLVFGPGGSSIEVLLDGTMGDTLILNGPSKLYRMSVADIDVDLPAGTYKTDQPESWAHGDGTVAIAARGLDTGMGWLDGESGPGVVYDPAIPAVSELMDYFHLTIEVAPLVNVVFDGMPWEEAGDPGEQVCGMAGVDNIGNVEAADVHFEVGNLVGETYFDIIPMSAVDFDPTSLVIPLSGSASTEICVVIPLGTREDTYYGTVALLADGEEQFDELTLEVTVGCIPAMNVSATELPTVLLDFEGSKAFEVCNLGNCDLSSVAGTVSGLPVGLTAVVNISDTVAWDGCENGTVDYSVAPEFEAGTYVGSVEITADGGLTGSFAVTVVVPEVIDIDFDPEYEGLIAEIGVAGESLTLAITLVNMGNVGVDSGITFNMTPVDGLVGDETGSVIPHPTAFPEGLAVPYEGETTFDLVIPIPEGLLGQDYTGTLQVLHEDVEMDVLDITITLERGEGYIVIFPNPFKMSENEGGCVTIALGAYEGDLSIMVYDMFGGLVADLGEDTEWCLENDDGKVVASGMYIVTIETDDEVVTRKIMVIK